MMQGVNKKEREVYLFALLRKDFASKRSAVTSHGVTNVVDTVYAAGMHEEEVDSSGNITAARKYDVYGLVRSGQAGSSSQKYVGGLGHESDTNTGLIYMRARYMDPVLGRFLSEDPSKDGANWFVYCGSNPIDQVDTTGHEARNVGDAFKSGFYGAFLGLVFGFFLALGYYLGSGSNAAFENSFGRSSLKFTILYEAAAFLIAFCGEYIGSPILSNLGTPKQVLVATSITAGGGFITGVVGAIAFHEACRLGMAIFCMFLIEHLEY